MDYPDLTTLSLELTKIIAAGDERLRRLGAVLAPVDERLSSIHVHRDLVAYGRAMR